MSEQSQKLNDFIKGQEQGRKDYLEHKDADPKGSEEYKAGYNFEYFIGEQKSAGQFN
jgi:hypothetical protein